MVVNMDEMIIKEIRNKYIYIYPKLDQIVDFNLKDIVAIYIIIEIRLFLLQIITNRFTYKK